MNTGLKDKVVWITGASGGIGKELAVAFGMEGCRLVLHSHSRLAKLESWVSTQKWKEEALCIQGDLRDPDRTLQIGELIRERFERLDVTVANAGLWPVPEEPLHKASVERIRETVDVNLFGAVWTARTHMHLIEETGPRPDGDGSALIFIGSTAGRFGERNHADYAMAKAALIGLMHSLKNEIPRIDPFGRVNVVEPGWTVTEMARPALDDDRTVRGVIKTMALRQLGRAEDVARTVVSLASPIVSRHVTGATLTVAGGMEGRTLWQDEEIDVNRVIERLQRETRQ